MFVDKARIYIKAGNGGDGAVSFHREKFVPNGGPDGGDGGRGGDVIFKVNTGMRTLMDFRYKKHFKAQPGENGMKNNKYGKSGQSITIEVPPGTIILDEETGHMLADMTESDQKLVLASGGKGGKGNVHFTTSTRQSPGFAFKGEKGEERWVILELKSIADVGLIGFPNVGKSTILSVLTSAKPKIANYHFTTLTPNLGIVKHRDSSFVLADIPGLIEGAHEGTGLGFDFLRHVERTRMLVHVIDVSGMEGRDPYKDFVTINEELKSYSKKLSERPQIIVANKCDIPGSEKNFEELKSKLSSLGLKVIGVSAVQRNGFDELLDEVAKMLDNLSKVEIFDEQPAEFVHTVKKEKPFSIEVINGVYYVEGPIVERILARVNLNDYESLQYFQRRLRQTGIIKALRKEGAKDGDTVFVGDYEFDYIE